MRPVNPRATYGTHGCFGAAVDEAQTLHAGERLADAFSQFGLQQGGNAITAAVAHGLDGCLVDQRIAIAQYEYTPRHAEIDVRIVVDIGEVAAFSLLDKERGGADTLECAHGTVHTARYHILAASKGRN